jgi:hypothetical protein
MATKKISQLNTIVTVADTDTLPIVDADVSETKKVTALNLQDYILGDATSADMAKLHSVTADATELNYVDGVTSAIQTQLNSKRLYSKVLAASRDGTAASGDVSYTGVGFQPTSIQAIMSVNDTTYSSNGYADSARSSYCVCTAAANKFWTQQQLIKYTDINNWGQYAVVKSYDVDGFTLTWTKGGTPPAGTLIITFICYK